jgi:hypothetical protein
VSLEGIIPIDNFPTYSAYIGFTGNTLVSSGIISLSTVEKTLYIFII